LSEPWNLQAHLERESQKDLLRFSTAGSVDDGKSTLIGRLLHDSKNVYEDQLAAVQKNRDGHLDAAPDLALLTDGLKAEREQGITIDVAYRYFSTAKRKFIIADTPGHEQYTRNMATGASTADLALILIDARKGVSIQSKRHAFIASLLQIPHLIVVVNKMDLVDFDEGAFQNIKSQFSQFAAKLEIHDLRFIPVSALEGDQVVRRSENMPWFSGESLLEMLENIHIASDRNLVDLRFPVQYVNRPNADFRGYAGQVVSGTLREGADIMVLPSLQRARIKEIHTYNGPLKEAFPPLSVTLILEEELDISRGDMVCHPQNRPHQARQFEAMMVWMNEAPLDPGKLYLLKHTTQTVRAEISAVRYRLNIENLSREAAHDLRLNEIGRVALVARSPIFFDAYSKNRHTGSFILIDPDTNHTVAAAMLIDRQPEDQLPANLEFPASRITPGEGHVQQKDRSRKYGHLPLTLWLTGMASCGKKELAYRLEHALFKQNIMVTVLHGASMRHGMSHQLSFSAVDIAEHLRRVGETARLMNQAGMVVIGAFISPYQDQRAQISELIGNELFREVWVDVPVTWCRERDETGIYQQAAAGTITNVAGFNAPYEEPKQPAFTVPLDQWGFDRAVEELSRYVLSQI